MNNDSKQICDFLTNRFSCKLCVCAAIPPPPLLHLCQTFLIHHFLIQHLSSQLLTTWYFSMLVPVGIGVNYYLPS